MRGACCCFSSPSLSSGAEGARARLDDIPLVRALGAGQFLVSVDRCAEEVCAGVQARRVDVVVLCEVTHPGVSGWIGVCVCVCVDVRGCE